MKSAIGDVIRGRAPKASIKVRTHVWATGQDDNIGDSLLRRGYLAALQDFGPVSAWVGPGSDGYISGLTHDTEPEYCHSFFRWYMSAFADALQGRAVVALNAGELTISGKGAWRLLRLLPLLYTTRARGGSVLWLGASVPNHRESVRWVYSLTASLCTIVRWRENRSPEITGCGGVMPDWGFGLGSSQEEWEPISARKHMGIVLRGDREVPGDDWFEWVSTNCRRLDLLPQVIVQVKRDIERARYIADRFGCEVTPWLGDENHRMQEKIVRDAYSKCALVVGDRLHGLVVASTEGAVPLAWTPTAREKVRSHFLSVGADWVGLDPSRRADDYPLLDREVLQSYFHENELLVGHAREDLAAVISEMGIAIKPAYSR